MTTKPATDKSALKRIRLHLAREPGHPQGSATDGYDFVAPLGQDSHIDPEGWREHRALCRVVRFREDEDDDVGHLVRRPGGSWAFRYDVMGDEDDEAGFHFAAHPFTPGEYVSISEDGELHTYVVASVRDL